MLHAAINLLFLTRSGASHDSLIPISYFLFFKHSVVRATLAYPKRGYTRAHTGSCNSVPVNILGQSSLDLEWFSRLRMWVLSSQVAYYNVSYQIGRTYNTFYVFLISISFCFHIIIYLFYINIFLTTFNSYIIIYLFYISFYIYKFFISIFYFILIFDYFTLIYLI